MTRPPVRAVFLGTPAAAVPSLVALSRVSTVVAAITRPDRPRGRSSRPVPSPVKEAAAELGIAVVQPAGPSELMQALEQSGPIDVGVVTAYGALIRPEALALPGRGFLNVHFSLLPRWRGAAPVAAAILAGDAETGVTLMHLDEGLDTGPIVAARTAVIGRDETAGELTGRLAGLGADLLSENLEAWVRGALSPIPQPGTGVTNAPKLSRADRRLDPKEPSATLVRRIRALSPRPGATLTVGDVHLGVLAARTIDRIVAVGEMSIAEGRVLVGAGGGAVELLTVQPPGRRPMAASAWVRGLRRLPKTISD